MKRFKLVMTALIAMCGVSAYAQQGQQQPLPPNYQELMQKAMTAVNAKPGQQAQEAAEPDDENTWETVVTEFSGSVSIKTGGENSPALKARKGVPLASGDVLVTGEGASAEISFDGGAGIAKIGENTSLHVDSLSYNETSLSLKNGSLSAKIKNIADENRNFAISTSGGVCAVRGTELAVEYLSDTAETRVGVFDNGHLGVTLFNASQEQQELSLGKDQEATFKDNAKTVRARRMVKLLAHKIDFTLLRQHASVIRKTWKRMTLEQREALRGKLSSSGEAAATTVPKLKLKSMNQMTRREQDRAGAQNGR